MKVLNLSSISALVALVLSPLFVLAQQQTTELTLTLKAHYNGSQVLLRWAPADFRTWDWGNQQGYNLIRYTTKIGGVQTTPDEYLASEVVLGTAIKPLPEMQWEQYANTSDLAGIVAGCIYGDSLEATMSGSSDFLTTYNTNNTRENRFGFSLYACDQDFFTAKNAGLGFTDITAVSGLEYFYVVALATLPANSTQKKGALTLSTVAPSALPSAPKPKGYPSDKAMILSWSTEGISDIYTSYKVERSQNNGTSYTTRDVRPFVSLAQANAATNHLIFSDSLTSNTTNYVYRIKGKTIFGQFGPYSDTLKIKGKNNPVQAVPAVDSVVEYSTGRLKIHWTYPTDSLILAKTQRFEIFHSTKIDGEYTFLANANKTRRFYNHLTPGAVNYYIVKVRDLSGNYNASFPILGQPKDEIAPAPPTPLTGICDRNGRVTVTWSPNYSLGTDLMGYRVFYSNEGQVDSSFAQMTSTYVNDTTYSFYINLKSTSRHFYVALMAVDFRENQSAFSQYLQIERYDIIPPSAPVIDAVTPLPAAVAFTWMGSSSRDIAAHRLERAVAGTPDWHTIQTFNGFLPDNYTDSASYIKKTDRRRWYNYRLIAIDASGLETSSSPVRIKPLDQGMRDTLSSLSISYLQTPKPRVRIAWDYPDDMDLVGFQIFRGIDTNLIRSYEFIAAGDLAGGGQPNTGGITHYTYTDYDMSLKSVPLRTTFVQPNGSGGTSITPNQLNQPINITPNSVVNLHYRVQAVFADGALSPLSPLLSVTIF